MRVIQESRDQSFNDMKNDMMYQFAYRAVLDAARIAKVNVTNISRHSPQHAQVYMTGYIRSDTPIEMAVSTIIDVNEVMFLATIQTIHGIEDHEIAMPVGRATVDAVAKAIAARIPS